MHTSASSHLHFRRIVWVVAGVPGWQLFQLSSGFLDKDLGYTDVILTFHLTDQFDPSLPKNFYFNY